MYRVAREPKRIVFPKADDPRVLRSLEVIAGEGIARPVVLTCEKALREQAEQLGVKLDGVEFVSLARRPSLEDEILALLAHRGRRGMTGPRARALLSADATMAGMMMVRQGHADGVVAGLQHGYPETIRMALQLIGPRDGHRAVAGVHVVVTAKGPMFFADTTVNVSPDAAMLADIAQMTAELARDLGVDPHVAMLSFGA
jgi:malate dehydrogenase (oxaloacetate-decarboxylating)(NADP+)